MKKLLLSLLLLSSVSFAEVSLVDDSTFKEQILDASACGTTVVVDIYTDWCPACKVFAPMFHQASEDKINSNLKFVRINADNGSLPPNIQYLPTVIIYRQGKAIRYIGGFQSAKEFQTWINKNK